MSDDEKAQGHEFTAKEHSLGTADFVCHDTEKACAIVPDVEFSYCPFCGRELE